MRKSGNGYPTLYILALVYAGIAYFGGDGLGALTVVFIGIPMIAYLVAFVLTYVLAAVSAYSLPRRRSLIFTWLVGFPCALLYAAITPMQGDKSMLGVPVPWLAVSHEHSNGYLPHRPEVNVACVALVFVVFFLLGWLMRKLRPTPPAPPSP
ncbi:MAG: hypothetical protein ACREP7_16545 [Lysobacter sp.]